VPYDTTEVGSLLEPQITLIPLIDVEPEVLPEELAQGHVKVLEIAGKKAGPVEQPRLLKCRAVVTAPACRVEDVDLDQALPTYNAACLLSIAIRCRASVVISQSLLPKAR
jgi:hypothetical protein